jgi:hypothetical protein
MLGDLLSPTSRKYWVTVGYFCYRGKEPSVNNEFRTGGMSIAKQQGMEVLGAELSPSVSVKDRSAVLPLPF